MLRADVDNEVVFLEDARFGLDDRAVGLLDPALGEVALALVFDRHGVDVGVGVVVFQQRVSLPVDAEEQTPHIGIVYEDDSEKVVDLALIDAGNLPEVADRVDHGLPAVAAGDDLHGEHLAAAGR